MTRIFHTVHWLTPKEQQKVREDRRRATEGPVQITYRKKRCVEDVELNGGGNPHGFTPEEWASDQSMILAGITPPVFSRYVTVFGACEARDGECCRKLEDAWNAEQIEMFQP